MKTALAAMKVITVSQKAHNRSAMLPKQLAIFGLALTMIPLAKGQGAQARQMQSLDGTWQVTRLPLDASLDQFTKGGAKTIPAAVPGEIHLDLVLAGEMQDPSISYNSRKDRWPERFSWWYHTTFTTPAGFTQQDRQEIVFDGLIYDAQIFLNGKLAGASRNGLVPYRLDATGLLKPGENDLVVRLTSGYELVNEVDQDFSKQGLYKNRENFPARSNLRTPPYMSGWDWCDTLPNIGIWRSVRLEGRSRAQLSQVRLDTVMNGAKVSLEGDVSVTNLRQWVRTPCTLQLELQRPNGPPVIVKRELALGIGTNHIPCKIDVPEPKLWWPNGMGDQPLYKLTATVSSDGVVTDSHTQTIGLRTIQLDQSPRKVGSNFRFIVNGKAIFAKGGNWAPADQIPARMTKARYDHFIQAAKDAHFNLLRVNGVGYYEDDDFYEACDRAGILVWQEFAYSCTTYNDRSPEFMQGARSEAEAFVKRIAHHPSLAMWCGCNECIWMYTGGKNPAPTDVNGFKIYFDLLPSVLHDLDPLRPYIPGSPCGGADEINSQTGGDVHWWYQVFMSNDPARKMNPALLDDCQGRFVSEYGIIGPPPLASMKEYLAPDELNPSSLAWKIHTNSYEGDHAGFTESALRHHFFGDGSLSVEQFVLYGGLYQAMMQEGMMEAGRFRKHDPESPCDGTLMWSYNDCWGEIGWSIIDHYGRLKPSYYAVKRATAPVKVIVRSRGPELVTRVVNDSLDSHEVEVIYGWFRVDGTARDVQTRKIKIAANSMAEVGRAKASDGHDPKQWVYAATMTGPGIDDDHSIWKLLPCRELRLPEGAVKVVRKGDTLTVSSDTFCSGVHLGGEHLSDDYFELLPGVPHVVRILRPSSDGRYNLVPSMPIGR
ncbi:MAG: glycosyl hydrolase 2 galactose-binding domain-containing protein [Fimbriimonadales bacterium]